MNLKQVTTEELLLELITRRDVATEYLDKGMEFWFSDNEDVLVITVPQKVFKDINLKNIK